MARAYSNDLRRKLLEAHEQGQGTLEELAEEFRVSLGFAKKISAALRRTGRMERTEQRHGRRNRVTPLVQERLREWLRQQPDLTLGELQRQLGEQVQVSLSIPRLWVVLRQMKLRLKKSRSTPRSRTPRKTGSAAKLGGRR
jgi:transposase